MRTFVLSIAALAALAGCVAVPVAEPGVYVSPPTVVIQPGHHHGGYYYYDRGPRYHYRRHHPRYP
jgi:hypothetical protein